jgi:uncharacterized hydrophobic protein (TIGR00271 family)
VIALRISCPDDKTAAVMDGLAANEDVTGLALVRGASVQPPGDLILADVAREAANDIVDSLIELGVHRDGTIHLDPATTWISRTALAAEQRAPGSSADAVVWADVSQRAYSDSELNWTYLSFMTMATMIASIAIVLDSQILVIGAMVLGPEFGAIAALGLALVTRRPHLLRFAARTVIVGFVLAILATTLWSLIGRALGWITIQDIEGPRPDTAFIYTPDKWSFLVAMIAAAAGVLSLTSDRVGGLSGVFISVTTVPAAGNVALGIAFWNGQQVWGSTLQLIINITGMAIAGWLTLLLQRALWSRVTLRRLRALGGRPAID